MTTNDWVTAALAGAALVVSAAALWINRVAGKRAARSALTDLALEVSKQAGAYKKIRDDEKKFRACQELEVLIRQADDLVNQLGARFPEAIAITLAQTLELVADSWWADYYWLKAVRTKEPYFRAMTISYWAQALWDRGERDRGREKTGEAVLSLSIRSTDAHIVRGDIYRRMGQRDWDRERHWFGEARREYEQIPPSDERHRWYLEYLETDEQLVAQHLRESGEPSGVFEQDEGSGGAAQ